MMIKHLSLILACLLVSPVVAHAEKNLIVTPTYEDLKYGNASGHKLDVYTPTDVAKNAPIIFMVHGGAWKIGDKTSDFVVKNKVEKWVSEGFIFVSTNYRFLPVAPYNQAQDIRKALAFVQTHAREWGGDPDKVIMMGHSAGAHLVALVNAYPELAYRLKVKPWLGNVILDSAALDVVSIMEQKHHVLYDRAFSNKPFLWRRNSPDHQLKEDAFPMLLVCSTRREISCLQARNFEEHAKSLGVKVSVSKQDLSHRNINKYLGLESEYTDIVNQFMNDLLGN